MTRALLDMKPKDVIGSLTWRPTTVQLFRFSAVTWNAHRIHFDLPYAREEGYDEVLVQGHLHGCYLAQTVLTWAAGRAELRRFRWQNRQVAVPGDVLTCTGVVASVEERLVHCELEERNQRAEICASAWATLELS